MHSTLIVKKHVFCADFETTSYKNYQIDGKVRVFLWSLVNCEDLKSYTGNDIPSFLVTLIKCKARIVYFHNLKFDGNFLLYYFLTHNINCELIAPNNNWYLLLWNGIEFRDSLKKFHCTVKELAVLVGNAKKLTAIDECGKNIWENYIPENYNPTQEIIDYCVRDSEIVARAIAHEWDCGRCRLTASSEAYQNARKNLEKFKFLFPKLNFEDDKKFRATYRGGICAVNSAIVGQEIDDIYAYDVNGMYGAVMMSDLLPYGDPYDGPPKSDKDLYVVNFSCEFYVKEKKFPFLQIKRNLQYYGRETEFIRESEGMTNLSLTSVDFELFKKHYTIYNDFDYIYTSVRAEKGILAPIIEKNIAEKDYWSQKEHYSELKRTIAKYNTNMLYGSFGISSIKDECTPELVDGIVHIAHKKTERDGRYIPYATLVTAQARRRMIDAIQKNYSNWLYSDTDSMYLSKKSVGIEINDTKSGAWKMENYPKGKFLRQKTYCLADNDRKIYKKFDGPKFWSTLKCAGMPDEVKKTVEWDDFKMGAKFEGRLQHRVVEGGVCLIPCTYIIGE